MDSTTTTTTTSTTTTSSTVTFDMELNITVTEQNGADYFYQVEQLTFLWVLFTLIVIGNSTVLIALITAKGRKSRMNFFIKHLAAADLCVGLISVLTDIIWKITISWDAGIVVCKLIRFLQALVTYSSTYVLVALSIDRYDAITHPMNFSGSWRRAKVLVAVAWILSAVFSSPILYFYYTAEVPGYGNQCWITFDEPWQWQVYMTLVSMTLFVIPAILIAACYIIIVCTIWNKGKELSVQPASTAISGTQAAQAAIAADGASVCTTAGGNIIQVRGKAGGSREDEVESRRASSRGLIPKAKVKTVKMTFVIIFVFILCWSPYIFFDLLQVFGFIPDNSTNRAVATFIQSLAPLNSAANPLIYCLFSTNIGATLCNLFGCRKTPANMSTGMTTSTHSSSNNKPTSSTSNGSRSHQGLKNDASLRPLLSNSVSVSGDNKIGNGRQKLMNQRSVGNSNLM